MTDTTVISTADMRGDHRNTLTRIWDPDREPVVFILLNPSTADEVKNDPTIRRCIRYAKDWGYGGLVVVNLYAYRTKDPKVMFAAPDPVGPDNDRAIVEATTGRTVVCAWGTNAKPGRVRDVLALIPPGTRTLALQLTKGGHPQHPLFVRGDVTPLPWPPAV